MKNSRYRFERKLLPQIDATTDPQTFVEAVQRFLWAEVDDPKELVPIPAHMVDLTKAGLKHVVPGEDLKSLERVLGMRVEYLKQRCLAEDQEAVGTLVRVAADFAGAVKLLSLRQPQLMSSVAQDLDEWPSMISFHGDWERENDQIIKGINLGGKETALRGQKRVSRLPGKTRRNRSILNEYCNRLLEFVEAVKTWLSFLEKRRRKREVVPARRQYTVWMKNAEKLEQIAPGNAAEWFKVGWQGLRDLTQGRIEELPELRRVGEYRKGHKATAGSENSNIREGIQTKLLEAFLARFG